MTGLGQDHRDPSDGRDAASERETHQDRAEIWPMTKSSVLIPGNPSDHIASMSAAAPSRCSTGSLDPARYMLSSAGNAHPPGRRSG